MKSNSPKKGRAGSKPGTPKSKKPQSAAKEQAAAAAPVQAVEETKIESPQLQVNFESLKFAHYQP